MRIRYELMFIFIFSDSSWVGTRSLTPGPSLNHSRTPTSTLSVSPTTNTAANYTLSFKATHRSTHHYKHPFTTPPTLAYTLTSNASMKTYGPHSLFPPPTPQTQPLAENTPSSNLYPSPLRTHTSALTSWIITTRTWLDLRMWKRVMLVAA